MKHYKRPIVLSIAGYDPCGGAGVLADIKTFESLKVKGLAVITSITDQNEKELKDIHWVDPHIIFSQLDALFSYYSVKYAKIGLVSSIEQLTSLVLYLKNKEKEIKIVWDPIVTSSSGYPILKEVTPLRTPEVLLQHLYMITPNHPEITALTELPPHEGAHCLSHYVHVYLKGGHAEGNEKGRDYLYAQGGNNKYPFRCKKISAYSKHGSGCVFSAALVASLAKGYPLIKACLQAKDYATRFLHTNQTLWGYHKI